MGIGPRACDPKVVRLGSRCVLIMKITESISNKYRAQVWIEEDFGFAALDAGHFRVPARAIGSSLSGCAGPFRPVLGGG